ncbi:MAG: hypothetical protein ABH856_01110 [Patescibacteria group bacterium]|nr:hypothetical protein [Patescibacteria group bacterium]
MIKISDAIRRIIEKNPILKFGVSYGLFNLTQLAKFIIPQVEARTKKEVRPAAITMSLSRIQREMKKTSPKPDDIRLEHITVHSNLCTLTYFKSAQIHEQLNQLYDKIQKEKGYMTITESGNEITIIIKTEAHKAARKLIKEEPKNERKNITAIGIQFPQKYNETPGLLSLIIQQLTLQYINIVEIASTYTELFIYVDQKDTRLAFDTLLRSFQD